MEQSLNAKCTTIFEEVITSDLGVAVFSYFQDARPNSDQPLPFLLIRDKLEEHQYETPDEWYEDIENQINETARHLEVDSDIYLSLLTLLDMIKEKSLKMLTTTKKSTIEDLKSIMNELEGLLPEIPDNINDLKVELEKSNPLSPAKSAISFSEYFAKDESIDIQELYNEMIKMPTDTDLSNIVDIITRYDTKYSHFNNIVEIDLQRCSPFTLKKIKEYIMSHKEEENYNSSAKTNVKAEKP